MGVQELVDRRAGRDDGPPAAPRVCFVSTVSSHGPGGLSAYLRLLRRALGATLPTAEVTRFGHFGPSGVDYAAREDPHVVPESDVSGSVRVIAPSGIAALGLSRVHNFVNRPAVASIGIRTFTSAYARSLSGAIPRSAEVIHYIGAGWELLGHPAMREARRRGAAFTVTPAVHPGTWGDSGLDMRFYRAADAVFALSAFERDYLIDLGLSPDRVHVAPSGPGLAAAGDAARFRSEHALGERPLVLYVGRKQRYKGYHALRESIAAVTTTVPDACLVSVGQDVEPPYPTVPEGAHLDLGPCDERQKADALAACDVFCMPSDGESLGISYLEAWANRKPVVAGMAPAVEELVQDGTTGFRVENNAEAVSPALIRLLRDSELRRRLGEAGHALQQDRFTWEAAAELHLDVFASVCGTDGFRRHQPGDSLSN